VATATVTFWWVESGELGNALTYGGHDFSGYPITVYGALFRRLFAYGLGFAFVAYYPALALLGRHDPLGRTRRARLWLPADRAVAAVLAGLLWRAGVGTTGARGRDWSSRRAAFARSSAVRVKAGWLRRRTRIVAAVDDIDLSVERGETLGYIGPNGAGKSTTLKMLTGVLYPSAGHVRVCGLEPVPQRLRLARRIGVVFGQRSQLWWDLPLADSFALLRHVYGVPAADHAARLGGCRRFLDLDPFLDTPVRQLSLGQRMRGELTAALLHGPEVLFFDEPTIGLDVVSKQAVRAFLEALGQSGDTTLVLTTHDLADIERLCRRLVVIDHGRVVHDGSLDELPPALRLAPPGGRGPRRAAGRAAVLGPGWRGGREAGGRRITYALDGDGATAGTWCAGWPRSPRCATSRWSSPTSRTSWPASIPGRDPRPAALTAAERPVIWCFVALIVAPCLTVRIGCVCRSLICGASRPGAGIAIECEASHPCRTTRDLRRFPMHASAGWARRRGPDPPSQ
jgi:ABC-2 type transport system ATP-binding protein